MRAAFEKKYTFRTALLSTPAMLWLVVLFFIPLSMIIGISFLSNGAYGELEQPLTLDNYKRFAGFSTFGWEAIYPAVIGRSLLLAAITMLLCVGFGLPLAFWISSLSRGWKTLALTLVVIPLWTNLLIRTYAWQLLLSPYGALAKALGTFGLAGLGESLYPGTPAVCIGMVCDYLPFLVLPLYASVEKIDWALTEAARDLGASGWRVFRHGVLPQIVPGLAAGIILVFVPATGQFVIPDLLGGSKTVLLGNVIQQQFGASRNWPFGSAIATAAMLIVLTALWVNARLARRSGNPELI